MVTAIVPSARHLPGIAASDAIAAHVTMMTIVLRLAALARLFEPNNRVPAYALIASTTGVMAALVLVGGQVGPKRGHAPLNVDPVQAVG